MDKKNALFLTIVVTLSFLLSLFFCIGFRHPVEGDARQYNIIAWNLLRHGAYSLSERSPYLPTTLREPAYTFFLALLIWLFKGNYAVIHGVQIIAFIFTVLSVYYLSSRVLGGHVATYATFITALCPTLANYPSYLLTETLFTFLIILFILAILKAVEINRTGWYIYSGFLLGLSALTKSIAIFLFIPIVLSGILYVGSINSFLKGYLKNFTVFVLTFSVIVAPWFIRNYIKFGNFTLSLQLSRVLFVRSLKLDYNLRDTKKEILFSLSENLGKRFYPEVEDSNHLLLKEAIENEKEIKKWTEQGYSEADINRIQMDEAITKISRRPLKYLSQNLLESLKLPFFLYIPLLNESHIIERFRHMEKGQFLLSSIKGTLRLLACLALFFAFFGFFAQRRKWRQWIFIAALIIYMNLSYSFLFCVSRYNVPLIPFYFMFAVSGFIFLKNKILRERQ